MYERLFKSAPSNIQRTDGIVNCGLWSYQLWLCVLAAVCAVELSTNLRQVSQCPEKAPTRAISLLKASRILSIF